MSAALWFWQGIVLAGTATVASMIFESYDPTFPALLGAANIAIGLAKTGSAS